MAGINFPSYKLEQDWDEFTSPNPPFNINWRVAKALLAGIAAIGFPTPLRTIISGVAPGGPVRGARTMEMDKAISLGLPDDKPVYVQLVYSDRPGATFAAALVVKNFSRSFVYGARSWYSSLRDVADLGFANFEEWQFNVQDFFALLERKFGDAVEAK